MPPPLISRIGRRPRAGGPVAPLPAPAVRRKVRPDCEYVAGGYSPLDGYYKSLPPWVDLYTRDFGPDLYDRMQLDDQVSSSIRALVHSALADDLTVRPAVDKEDEDGYAPSKQLLEFVERATGNLDLETWLLAMLKGAVGGGNRVSETVYEPTESGPDAGLWRVDRVKVKPRRSLAFVVDAQMNLAGFLGLLTGQGSVSGFGAVTFDPADPPENFIPRDKFVHLCWDPKDSEPGGTPILQCVYTPWWEKLQAAREWLKHLARFGSGSLVGTLPPNAEGGAAVDAEGNPTGEPELDPAQQYLNKLVAFQNGSAIVKGHGYELELLQSSNAGTAFLSRVDYSDRAIARGVLLAMRTTMEAKTGSKADAEAAQDVTGLQTRFVKRWAARAVTDQLYRTLVKYCFGPEAARLWCPYASLSPVEHQDLGATLASVSNAYKLGFLKPSQLPWAYEQFGMPPATAEEMNPPEPPAVPPGQAPGPGQPPASPPPGGAPPGTAPFAEWDETKHPRGQPENRGEFGPGGGAAEAAERAGSGGPRRVDDPGGWGREHFGAWADALSDSEKKAVSAYKRDSEVVNGPLREGGHMSPAKEQVRRQLTRALAKSFVPHAVVAYRGAPAEFYDHLSEGQVFEDRGFVSTTVARRVADTFKDALETGEPGVVITVLVPKGAAGAYVDTFDNSFGHELLLQRGSRFVVLKKKGRGLLVRLLPRKGKVA